MKNPHKKIPKKTEPSTNQAFSHEDPGQDWTIRRKNRVVPFDVLVICQDAEWAKRELTFDFSAELAAIIPTDRPVYRLPDGRFASLTNRAEVIKNAPKFLDIWNWWTHYLQPGLTDFEESTRIDGLIAQRVSSDPNEECETCH